jgi:3-hydroxybutyryl-CoA dehydrogenase
MTDRVLIVGGGTMGAGIAFVAAQAGLEVEVVEPQAASRERGVASVQRDATRAGADAIAERVRWSDALPSGSEAMLAIEAVPEVFELKRDVFVALAGALAPEALLATNTSSLAVGDLADVVPHPERVLGLHFFNPPQRMQLIEVVAAAQTSDETIERGFQIVTRMGKHPVLTADTPGFIVNRVARPYYLQALRALERGVASVEELDALARAAGFRMGPFELMDLIGLDVNLATTESVFARTEERRLAPIEMQRQMVAQGRLGRKTGTGFYTYRDGRNERFEPSVEPQNADRDAQERITVVGFGGLADDLAEAVARRYERASRVENDELLDELDAAATVVIDVGDGSSDRGEIIARLDAVLGPETILFVDAYATDLAACARRLQHPERLVGYGILGSLAGQSAIEIVDSAASDDALELAQELFANLGKAVILVEDVTGLFLGRTVGSIVNEAMVTVAEHVAAPEDVDTALVLGANYPRGPIAWGREIGGARIARILRRLTEAEGEAFAPHRSLWVLDLEPEATEGAEAAEAAQ